ncbi:MAG: hypothetical protein GEV08_19120 [Acidimicrobiia bacterium]|nr:hypothetical protein [Acidimicrobiia bacterium]
MWNVALCRGTGGDDETCELDNVDTGSKNNRAVYADNQDFYAYLNNPNADDESGNYLGFQLSATDPTFLLVFGDNPPDCAIAGPDASSNWTYTGADNRNCTLAKDIQAILAFQDPLSADFQCWVSYAPNQNPYQCWQGPPNGYGPPGTSSAPPPVRADWHARRPDHPRRNVSDGAACSRRHAAVVEGTRPEQVLCRGHRMR